MSRLTRIGRQRVGLVLLIVALLALAAIEELTEKEIALVIGEPYEAMRQRSSASIDPAIPGHSWFSIPKSDARLRLADPQYGFVTPQALFFTVMYNNEVVEGVRMSPQIEPLLLDDTLKIVLDLQEQWRNAGWTPIRVAQDPPFADTPQWRAQLRDVKKGGVAYWQAGNRYKAMLVVHRFKDKKRPTEERYLITLELSKSRGER